MNWLQNHLISCPFKALTGIDCPGCGFQRSLLALIKGDLVQSWHFYPPTILILVLFITTYFLRNLQIKNSNLIIKIMAIVVGNFIFINYLVKMF